MIIVENGARGRYGGEIERNRADTSGTRTVAERAGCHVPRFKLIRGYDLIQLNADLQIFKTFAAFP